MTSYNSSESQGMSRSNMLSPEAKEFIPRQQHDPAPDGGAHDESGIPTPAGDGLLGPAPEGLLNSPPINGLPGYVTTCYPFVPAGDGRFSGNRNRFPGKYDPRDIAVPQFLPGMPRNRFPNPGSKGFNIGAWNQSGVGDVFPNYGAVPHVPSGMTFDGGTYQNGMRPMGFPQMYMQPGGRMVNGIVDPNKHHKNNIQEEKPSTEIVETTDNSRTIILQTDFPSHIADSSLDDLPNSLYNTKSSTKTEMVPDSSHAQQNLHYTPSQLSHNASDHPQLVSPVSAESLMTSSVCVDHMRGSEGHVTFALNSNIPVSAFSGGFHSLDASSQQYLYQNNANGSMQYFPGVSVPYTGQGDNMSNSSRNSYASVAQNGPSQIKSYINDSVAKATGDQKTCDNGNSAENSGKRVPKPGAKSRYGSVNILDIMQDLERADKEKKDGKTGSKLTKTSTSANDSKIEHTHTISSTSCSVISQTDISTTTTATTMTATTTYPDTNDDSNNVKEIHPNLMQAPPDAINFNPSVHHHQTWPYAWPNGNKEMGNLYHLQNGMKFVQNIENMPWQSLYAQQALLHNQPLHGGISFADIVKTHQPLQVQGQNQVPGQSDNNNNMEGEVKKRKRRRRRRKKKGDAVANNDAEVEDAVSGANDDEVTLHFEDEQEFPDLGVSEGEIERQHVPVNTPTLVAYSETLKNNTPVQSTWSSQDESCTLSTVEMTSAQAAKESRTSRKRRKRREVANKAAEAEMAEINLEQHMLELKMKQKLPLSARKSVSPVRNAATQGVWKLAPSSPTSQPSPSGKKVCLVLPGTVAQEPAHSAPLQPSTAVKQPGILKTSSQPPVPTPSTSNTTGTTSPAPGAGGKKSKQPITYDFAAMIDASLESKKEQAKKEKEVKPVVIKKDDLKPVNQLDSSAPMVKRGKERETPKLKKPSPLKKVILKEREEKKRLRLLDDEDNQSAPVGIGVVSGCESDFSQDGNSSSYRQTDIIGLGTPNSAELSPISQPSPSCMSPLSPGTSPLSSGLTSPMTGSIQHTVKLKIHSRRFREYCNQVLDKEIDNSVIALLQDLVRFQDKQYHKDPVKAKAKRRFVLGLREVTKHLKLKKIKCVIISPNLEKIQSKGGLDDALNNILELCNDQSVPFIFGLGRRALGRACAKLVPVSVVGVFNYEGSEENYKSLIGLTERAREQYREMIHQIEKEVAEHPPRATTPGVPHIFAHMGHSRTPSGCSVISFTSSILSEPISENYPHSEPETDNRGYEIEKDVDELEDEMSNLQTDDAYEADDEEGFVRKKKKFVPRNIENPTKLQNGHAHSDDDDNDSELSDGQRVRLSNLESASGKVIRRPSILKNSAEWLKNRGKDFIDNNVNITNGTDEEFQSLPQNGDLVSSQQNHIMDNTNILKKQDLIKDHIHVKTSEYGAMIPSTKSFHNVDEKLVVVSNGDIVSSDSSANFQTCNEDSDFDRENKDTVSRLPTKFMDSVHHGDFVSETLSTLSQYSATTGEFDVMSTHSTTHSSQTIGEGTPHCSNINEKGERSSVSDLIDKKSIDLISQGGSNASMNSGMILKGKVKVDKENRTLSWVKEAQTLHFSEQAEQPRENEDGLSVSAGLECVDAVV
ncbi:uncharacterized protein LOC128221193 isoform X2 [Mya arenaria]|uniref:uncharacterized protein LOC128221193 isoform X2 n=1 Tax=Mya arenaria TaxID=6604 RepID=UPI0022E086DE|nr:uncharacterized protein LOC128221193 isoform X2 [Mya arenaria]